MKTKSKTLESVTNKYKEIFGVKREIIKAITDIIYLNNKVEQIIIFGSRAKGNFKKGSDIDLAIICNQLSLGELLKIKSDINELPIPYKVDIVDYNEIKNLELIDHINNVGKKINRLEKK
jgi:predicted nucleotidyltransferase